MNAKTLSLAFLNYALFALLILVFTGFQTSLWMYVMGYFPSPQFWLSILVFWSIYRSPKESLIMAYLISLLVAPFSAIPLKTLLMVHFCLFFLIFFIRHRIYWEGVTFMMFLTFWICLAFPFIHFLMSFILEPSPLHKIEFFDWTLRAILTTLLTPPLFYLYVFIDRMTKKRWPTEARSQAL
ncbi:MAG: hypothetical protein D6797_08410 [Bdellovibrio sp.]|nr:MAG: hypothetical protein D6797_08410 [Bdellovibrio sp.]